MKTVKQSSKTKPLSEAHIQATCTAWLALDNWRSVETDPKHLRGLGVSEPGIADRQYIRYLNDGDPRKGRYPAETGKTYWPLSETMWIEWKRKGGKAGTKQQEWHAKERALGALTLIAGEDFPASIEGFISWYAASGLQRKRISLPK